MDLLLLGANPPRAAWLLGPEITPPPLAKLLFQSGCSGSIGKKRIESSVSSLLAPRFKANTLRTKVFNVKVR